MMAPTSLKAGLLLLCQLHLTWAIPQPTASSSTLITSTSVPTMSSLASYQPQKTGTAANCDKYYLVQPNDSCTAIEIQFGLSQNEFIAWNPTVNKDCTNIIAGYYYCVSVPGSTKFSITTSNQTTPTNGVATPTPIQTGMATSCNKFYFVQTGDSCAAIATEYNVTLPNFYSWNPAVGSSCLTLNVGYHVCVDAIGNKPPNTTTTVTTMTTVTTVTTKTATSSAGNAIATPSPFEAGMVAGCKKFILVRSGDTCASIATSLGTTVANITKWNPGVGSNCTALWLGNYICVGV